jgi:diguanylate cyclase (GGDEF)-like protein
MNRSGVTATGLAMILGTALGVGMLASAPCQGSVVPKHNTIQDLKYLPVNSAVNLTGVITYVDEAGKLLWIQDPTGTMPVAMDPLPAGVRAGEEISIRAFTTAPYDEAKGPASVGLEHIRVRPMGAASPVPAGAGPLPTQPYMAGAKPAASQGKDGGLGGPPGQGSAQADGSGADKTGGTGRTAPETRTPEDLTVVRGTQAWTPSLTATMGTILGVLTLGIVVVLVRVNRLRRQVNEQEAELRKASENTQAIRELSRSMLQVAAQRPFDVQVPDRGSEEIVELVDGFNAMLFELQKRDRAKRDAEDRMQNMALIDDLTGLPNRRLLADRLSHSVSKARRENRKVALLYIDLDGFKLVNDSLGHSVGDVLLGQVAHRMKARFRQSDTLARIGSDEFTLILDTVFTRADAERAAEDALDVLKEPFVIDGHSIKMTASIGISIFPDHGKEGGQLLRQADCAMVAAKRNGKDRIVQFGDGLGSAARERLMLEGELRRAIDEGEIRVHYQPEFDLATNTIVRFEALARWAHPTLGPIPPLTFIPVAEESGLIVPLGAFVMEKACADAVIWQRRANRPIQVAVNISSVQFARDTFLEEVEETLRRTGLRPSLLQLELTESATLTGVERAADLIRRLTGRGIGVALDDFGTGYSCLSYLPKLFLDALKLDRSFVTELAMRQETRAFVQSILSMAHNLHMKVIVEGIETREQLELMKALGTNEAQGFLLGRPTPNPMEQLAWGSNAGPARERETETVSF